MAIDPGRLQPVSRVAVVRSELGRVASVELLKAKLERQAQMAERLAYLEATVRVKDARPVATAIREYVDAMHPDMTFERLRQVESSAGRNYWQTWARVPVSFDSSWGRVVPEHWHRAGARTSTVENKGRARKRPHRPTQFSTTPTRFSKPRRPSPRTSSASTRASESCTPTCATADPSRPT